MVSKFNNFLCNFCSDRFFEVSWSFEPNPLFLQAKFYDIFLNIIGFYFLALTLSISLQTSLPTNTRATLNCWARLAWKRKRTSCSLRTMLRRCCRRRVSWRTRLSSVRRWMLRSWGEKADYRWGKWRENCALNVDRVDYRERKWLAAYNKKINR